MKKNNELELMFSKSNIDFIGIAAKFLYDKKCSCEVVRRLYELKGNNYDDDISGKVAILMVEHVLAGLMRLHDDNLFENIESKKKKKNKNVESN